MTFIVLNIVFFFRQLQTGDKVVINAMTDIDERRAVKGLDIDTNED